MIVATGRFMLPSERFLRHVISTLWKLAGGDALQNSGRSLPRLGKAIVRSQESGVRLMLTLTQKFDFFSKACHLYVSMEAYCLTLKYSSLTLNNHTLKMNGPVIFGIFTSLVATTNLIYQKVFITLKTPKPVL